MKKKKQALKKKKVSTRERVLRAATESLVQTHVHGLRFSQIAKIAKVPQPLMGYHFPSVEALLFELIQRELDKLRLYSLERLEEVSDQPRKALEAYIRAPFELSEKDAGFRAIWTAFYHLASVDSKFADLNRAIRLTGRERILALLAVALEKSKSDARDIQSLGDLAFAIQGIITGYGFIAACETDGDYQYLADLAVRSCNTLLGLKS